MLQYYVINGSAEKKSKATFATGLSKNNNYFNIILN